MTDIVQTLHYDFGDDGPVLGELAEAVEAMQKSGAPSEAEILLTLGDKGSQRDPWTFLRGITARWTP